MAKSQKVNSLEPQVDDPAHLVVVSILLSFQPEDSEIDQHCARTTFPDRSVSTPLGLKLLWFGDCLVTVAVHI